MCPYGSVSLHPRHEDRPRNPELKDSEERLPIQPLESGASTADSRIVGFGGAFGHPAAGRQSTERRVECVLLIGRGLPWFGSGPDRPPSWPRKALRGPGDRRVLQGDKIPHGEKVFSIFEDTPAGSPRARPARRSSSAFRSASSRTGTGSCSTTRSCGKAATPTWRCR